MSAPEAVAYVLGFTFVFVSGLLYVIFRLWCDRKFYASQRQKKQEMIDHLHVFAGDLKNIIEIRDAEILKARATLSAKLDTAAKTERDLRNDLEKACSKPRLFSRVPQVAGGKHPAPEHKKRGADHTLETPLTTSDDDVIDAYMHTHELEKVSDYHSPNTWKVWALREAYLIGLGKGREGAAVQPPMITLELDSIEFRRAIDEFTGEVSIMADGMVAGSES